MGTTNDGLNLPLSVVVPTLNAARTLPRALESLAAQRFHAFEVYVADGASLDGTVDIARTFATRFSLQVSTEKDTGIYDAMNRGIRCTRGDWLYFLGADDFLLGDDAFHGVLNSPHSLGADILYGDVVFQHSGRVYDGRFGKLKLLARNPCHQAIFYRRRVFELHGLFDTRYRYLADYAFNLRCFGDTKLSIRHVDHLVAAYNERGAAFSLADAAFEQDKLALVRHTLGPLYYLIGRFTHRRWPAWVRFAFRL
jgi:glycosyltransferase involved in cell wall biosynthesis